VGSISGRKIGFNWDEVHDIAEQLEHIDSEELVEKLDEFLGFPKFDPHGDPIPDPNGRMPKLTYQNLSEVKQGERVLMMGVSEHSSAFLQYVAKLGISLGSELYILEINDFDKSLSVQIAQANPQFMSHEVAKNLLVKV
jgi:DtxR family Mn-dependent transcriptional regulator